MSKSGKKVNHLIGYIIVSTALIIGLIINVAANIIYEMMRDNKMAQDITLLLTFVSFIVIILTYHNKFKEPLSKLLQEFE